MVANKLKSVSTRTELVKDVWHLAPPHQTFLLKAFHSLILHFAQSTFSDVEAKFSKMTAVYVYI